MQGAREEGSVVPPAVLPHPAIVATEVDLRFGYRARTCSSRRASSKKEIENGIHAAGRGRRWGPEWLHGGFYRHRPCITARIGILNSSLTWRQVHTCASISIHINAYHIMVTTLQPNM